MSRRPTLAAVAEAAGVSTATVDRVLNSRLPVRSATAMRVIEAAERIGYHGAPLMRARLTERSEREVRTLGFCLLRRHEAFYRAFGRELSAAASQHASPCVAVIEYMDELEPAAIAERMLQLGRETDALGVVAVDHPHVSAAVEALHGRGCPTFALLSDLSAPLRAGFVGVDPRKSGRTAAWAISRLARRPGPVGVFVGSHRYLGHEACEMSFRAHLREHAPDFRVLETQVNLEDAQLAHEATLDLLRRHPDLAGLYDAGGGGMAGTIRALQAERPPGHALGHVVTVSNELTPEHRAALADGVIDLVLGTPQAAIARTVVQAMLDALERPQQMRPHGVQMTLPVEVYTAENM
ncbi:LacI family transcriptional regulator [Sphaerotilus hippei]|uniref:LacI family transcriptional regulator n=1 Tax=Sphaerotilus hippei TaxID=744406 RepID=A0A318GXJ7_9BURK|nr:LacI family DNA-binding transcriptional regulator [Sphaerotilus hippei]PXW93975.1 LacI family transcriptional regulator [Sphaerotilus hippei]